jgi:hypothetical protein
MYSATTNLNNNNLSTSVAFRKQRNTYPFSKFLTATNHKTSALSSNNPALLHPPEEEMATISSTTISGSCGENIYDDGRKKDASYRSSSTPSSASSGSTLALASSVSCSCSSCSTYPTLRTCTKRLQIEHKEAPQNQQLGINNKRKMAMMLSEEEEDYVSSSEDSTSEGSLTEEEDIVSPASNDDQQERRIQEPDDMMTAASAVASLIVEKKIATTNDPSSSYICSSSSSSRIFRRKNQTNKKRKLTVRFDLIPVVEPPSSDEEMGTMMRRKKTSFGQKEKPSSSSTTTITDIGRYQQINEDEYKSTLWWTPTELQHIELSLIFALKLKELGVFPPIIADTDTDTDTDIDILSLQRYTKHNRAQRKNTRRQMYLTVQAIKEFEIITKVKTPPELLSELLQRITTRKPATV